MPDKTPHIVFLSSYLDVPGGYEKIVVNTANLFVEKQNKVTLLIIDRTTKSYYPVHGKIDIKHLPLSFGITQVGNPITRKATLVKDIFRLRNTLKKLQPTLVISTEHPFAIAAVLGRVQKSTRLISWEHHHYYWLKKNMFWTYLFRKTYPGLDGIVCLTKTEKKHYERLAEAFVIPNFTQQQPFIPNDPDTNTILTVAGLIPRKGIDMLLEVASRILEENKDWKWKLIGDGELRKQVEKFISDAKLQDRFILELPSGHDISNEYCKASLFVLTSRFEALPMVLLEALSFGVPCVSFDCPSGPFEIIINNVNGKIVENGNTYEMKEAITEMISDHSLRKTMRQQAWESSKRYSPDRIYELWKKLF